MTSVGLGVVSVCLRPFNEGSTVQGLLVTVLEVLSNSTEDQRPITIFLMFKTLGCLLLYKVFLFLHNNKSLGHGEL